MTSQERATSRRGALLIAKAGARHPRRLALLAVVAVIGLVLVWTAYDVVQAANAARAGKRAALSVERDVGAKKWEAASAGARRLDGEVGRLQAAVGSPPLRLLSLAPLVGRDVRAVASTSDALADVAASLPPLVTAARDAESGSLMVDGKIDVDRIARFAAPAHAASTSLERASTSLHLISTAPLHFGLADQILSVRSQVDELTAQSQLLAMTAQRLPGLLGANSPQRYLLVDQNLAEARPTGGIFGAYAVLRAERGRLSLETAGVNNNLGDLDPTELDADEQARRLYGADLALNQNFNLSPDFPQAARLAAQLWERRNHAVQGVLAVDPVLVQSLLKVTGPVDVDGGPRLTGQNAADVLMRQVYSTLGGDTKRRNAYLVRSTGAVFQALFARRVPTSQLRQVLSDARRDAHLQAWSGDGKDQEFFKAAGLAGELAAPHSSAVGLYLTNVDGSKLDYYLHTTTTARPACSDARASLEVALRNDAPAGLPAYARNQLEPADSTASTNHVILLSLYLPPGRGLSTLAVDSTPRPFSSDPESGWTLVRAAVSVPAGKTVSVSAQLDGVSSAPQVLTQPMVRPVQKRSAACGQ